VTDATVASRPEQSQHPEFERERSQWLRAARRRPAATRSRRRSSRVICAAANTTVVRCEREQEHALHGKHGTIHDAAHLREDRVLSIGVTLGKRRTRWSSVPACRRQAAADVGRRVLLDGARLSTMKSSAETIPVHFAQARHARIERFAGDVEPQAIAQREPQVAREFLFDGHLRVVGAASHHVPATILLDDDSVAVQVRLLALTKRRPRSSVTRSLTGTSSIAVRRAHERTSPA
jgi:hypothetical protein